MMDIAYTITQKNRLLELGAEEALTTVLFSTTQERQKTYIQTEKELIRRNKAEIACLLEQEHRPLLCSLQADLADALTAHGFTQVVTPTIISAKAMEKMSVGPEHPLHKQIFWLDGKTCLRPMLAPGLYEVSRRLIGSQGLPMRIFEIGSCFRKESEGRSHLKEFTMLNLVEWGTPMPERIDTLKQYCSKVLEAAQITEYEMTEEDSVVYGMGLDVVGTNGLELASTSMGPHRLDSAWKINCTWIGAGFGLERLLMYREKKTGIHSYGRSTVYLNGACLKLQ